MRTAFSVAELVIVTAIIGILAALVVPQVQNHSTTAKEAAAKDNLHMLRSMIELYAAQHGDIAPGYKQNDPGNMPKEDQFLEQTVEEEHYMRKMPTNPFNGLDSILVVGDKQTFPSEATGESGWVYQPATKTIRLDWPGADAEGVSYFEY
jgi:general secretion pathway protein G